MPYATTISRDHRVDVKDEGTTEPLSSREAVEAAIASLDGRARTQVVLEGQDSALVVGGGNGGFYNVILAVGIDQNFYNLIDPSGDPTVSRQLVIGGQAGLYNDRNCVDLETALTAANEFYLSGKKADSLTWEE